MCHRFIIVFLIIIIHLPCRALDMPQIIACHESLTTDLKHLSPIYGSSLLISPVLENLRFVGTFGPESESKYKRYDQLTGEVDYPLTATSALIQHLFPSPTNALAISGRKVFLFKHIGMRGLATLVLQLETISKSEDAQDQLEALLKENSPEGSTKKELVKKKGFSLYSKMLLEALKESQCDEYALSPYFPQYLLTAYARQLSLHAAGTHKFGDFLEVLAPDCLSKAANYSTLDGEGYLAWKQKLQEPDALHHAYIPQGQIEQIIKDPLWAYQLSQCVFSYEEIPIQIDYGTTFVDQVTFSDCCESGALSLFLFLLVNKETNNLDLSRIPETACDGFKLFFQDYNPRDPNSFRSRWGTLLANLKDPRIGYKKVTDQTKCEIQSGIPNILRVFAEILGMPELAVEKTPVVDRLRLLELTFSKGNKRFDLDVLENVVSGAAPKEFIFEAPGVEFSLESSPGHTKVTYVDKLAIPMPKLDFEAIRKIEQRFVPLYANFFIPLLVDQIWFSKRKPENFDFHAFMDRRDTFLKELPQSTVFKIALCNSLLTTDAQIELIKAVLGLKLSETNKGFPALNHRLDLIDPYTNNLILCELLKHDKTFSQKAFPNLLERLEKAIEDNAYPHIHWALKLIQAHGSEMRMDEYVDICFHPNAMLKLRPELRDLHNLQEIAISFGNLLARGGVDGRIIERIYKAFHPEDLSRVVKLKYELAPDPEHPTNTVINSFPSLLITNYYSSCWSRDFDIKRAQLSFKLLSMLSDAEYEEACYATYNRQIYEPLDLPSNGFESCLLAKDFGQFQEDVLIRLMGINPQRFKSTKTNQGTALNALLKAKGDFLPVIKKILVLFGDDREWVLSPDDEGKTVLDRLRGFSSEFNLCFKPYETE